MIQKKDKKIAALIIIGILFAIIGWIYPLDSSIGMQWVVNNTNLAPFVSGHGGNGERIGDNTTYWANNSPIQILLWSHANTSGKAAEIHLYINGSKVSDVSGRPLGVAEESNRSIVATIPQYSYYSVEFVNYHHYEWREYPILTGTVTTNINTSGGTGGTMDHASLTNLNWANANHTIDTNINMVGNGIENVDTISNTSGYLELYSALFGNLSGVTFDTLLNTTTLYWNTKSITISDTGTSINNNVNMNGNNINEVQNINENVFAFNETGTTGGSMKMQFNDNLTYYENLTGSQKTGNDQNFDYLYQESNDDVSHSNLVAFQTIHDGTLDGFNFFQGRRARGSVNFSNRSAIIEPILAGDVMFRVVATGWNGNAWAGTRSGFNFRAGANDWNTTSMPAIADVYVSDSTGGGYISHTFNQTGNLEFTQAGKGIKMLSPDGNDWCVTVSNAGALTVSATPCS